MAQPLKRLRHPIVIFLSLAGCSGSGPTTEPTGIIVGIQMQLDQKGCRTDGPVLELEYLIDGRKVGSENFASPRCGGAWSSSNVPMSRGRHQATIRVVRHTLTSATYDFWVWGIAFGPEGSQQEFGRLAFMTPPVASAVLRAGETIQWSFEVNP